MKYLDITPQKLIKKLLAISQYENVSLLDSCGVNHLNSHKLIAGIRPVETIEITENKVENALSIFDKALSIPNTASVFTISYDFGLKIEKLSQRKKEFTTFSEPDLSIAVYDCLIIHDYQTNKTYLTGNQNKFKQIEKTLSKDFSFVIQKNTSSTKIKSNFSKKEYISAIKKIQEEIRKGNTYQTNLTQQFHALLSESLTPQTIFWNLRNSHPAPFASFIKRKDDFVVSISPERFIKVESDEKSFNLKKITTSPIKGTRPRGKSIEDDSRLKTELINSPKDRAENIMIVDLLRNDIGRICEFGTVQVEKLCDLESHPSIFHLVSTISGNLKKEVNFSEIIRATFPCGSITGCPKISTMKIIDEIETVNRGLSMGAIGYKDFDNSIDSSVAIRTAIIKNQEAVFNVGGGIVIDSYPLEEYEESLIKAKAIFNALNVL